MAADLFRICLVGDWGAGKSSIVLRFCDDLFSEEHQKTIGVDFKDKTIDLDDGSYKLRICDTAGQERFKTITSSYYRSAHAVILVYDINEADSHSALQNWLGDVKNFTQSPDEQSSFQPETLFITVANKIDLLEGANTETTQKLQSNIQGGKDFASSEKMSFYTASAKTGEGVTKLFTEMTTALAKSKLKSSTSGPSYNINPSVKPTKTKDKKSKCLI